MNADIMLDMLYKALPKIASPYFPPEPCELEIQGEILPDDKRYKPLQKYLTRYGERVFCYELYHQIRILMDDYYREHPNAAKLVFHGELRKGNLGGLEKLFRLSTGEIPETLNAEYIPDFLLHKPYSFNDQELVIEVKATPNLILGKDFSDGNPNPKGSTMKNDLKKIQEFITNYRYKKGVFLAVNASVAHVQRHLVSLNEGWLDTHIQNPERIVVLCVPSSGSSIYKTYLNQPGLELCP